MCACELCAARPGSALLPLREAWAWNSERSRFSGSVSFAEGVCVCVCIRESAMASWAGALWPNAVNSGCKGLSGSFSLTCWFSVLLAESSPCPPTLDWIPALTPHSNLGFQGLLFILPEAEKSYLGASTSVGLWLHSELKPPFLFFLS